MDKNIRFSVRINVYQECVLLYFFCMNSCKINDRENKIIIKLENAELKMPDKRW